LFLSPKNKLEIIWPNLDSLGKDGDAAYNPIVRPVTNYTQSLIVGNGLT